MTDLVARLLTEDVHVFNAYTGKKTTEELIAERHQAADRITALEVENAKLREELDYGKHRIAELTEEGAGFWRACSGCQESVEGCVSIKDYPYNNIFQCQPGSGCHECGGIGVIWDDTDYDAMARDILAEEQPAPSAPVCPMCDDTGIKDYAAFAMEPCTCKGPVT